MTAGGLRYIERGDYVPDAEPAKPKRPPRPPRPPAAKHDPKQIAAARELRDRYLEQINANAAALTDQCKYDVSRRIEAKPAVSVEAPKLLPQAA